MRRSRWKVKSRRLIHCTSAPMLNASATERKMPAMISTTLPWLMSSSTEVASVSPRPITSQPITTAAPSSSKMMETVVLVGSPSEL